MTSKDSEIPVDKVPEEEAKTTETKPEKAGDADDAVIQLIIPIS